MTFLYPSLLFGLITLVIPIIIHLFSFKRVKKVFFSNTQFLKDIEEQTASRRNLKHFLILASRMLFLFFLVLAFAQPVINSTEKADNQGIDLLFYIDNSMSMVNQIDTDLAALDQAIQLTESIANKYPLNTRFYLLTNDKTGYQYNSLDRSALGDRLAEINYSANSLSASQINDRVNNVLKNAKNKKKEVIWFSDFQKSTLKRSLHTVEFDSTIQFQIIPFQFESNKNIYVDTTYLTVPQILDFQDNQLEIVVKNDGKQAARNVQINFFVNDIQIGSKQVNVAAKGDEKIIFPIKTTLKSQNSARITIEDYPVSFDNTFYFSLNKQRRPKVVEVFGQNAGVAIQKVYGNQKIFDFKSYSLNNIDYTQVENADFVILNQLENLPNALRNSILIKKTDPKNSILWIPAIDQNAIDLNGLFPAKKVKSETEIVKTKLQNLDYNNPFFKNMFEQKEQYLSLPTAFSILETSQYQSALLKQSNGQAFISVFGKEENFFVLASPLVEPYTDFQNHALFVPVMYRLAQQSAHTDDQLFYRFEDENISLTLDSLQTNEIFKLKNTKLELVPAQRILGNNLILEIPQNTIKPGVYELIQKNKGIHTVAFNLKKEESKLESVNIEEIKAFVASRSNFTIDDKDNGSLINANIEKRFEGIPLWKYMVILSLVFLLVEIFLLRFL